MQVKQYERQIKNTNMPNVQQSANANANSFGMNQARDLQRVSQTTDFMGGILEEHEIRRQKTKAKETFIQAQQESQAFLSELHLKEGEEATKAVGTAKKKLTEMREKYIQNLESNFQQDLFNDSFGSFEAGSLNKAAAFQAQAVKKYEQDTIKAESLMFVKNAIVDRDNMSAIEGSSGVVTANALELTKGQPPEVRKLAVQKATTDLYVSVTNAKLQDDPEKALAFIKDEKVKSKIDPLVYAELKREIEDKALFSSVQRRVEANVGLPLGEQLAKASKIQNAKESQLYRSMVKDRFAEKEFMEKRANQEKMNGLVGDIFKDPSVFNVNKIGDKVTYQEQEHLYALQQKLLAEKSAGAKNSNPDAYYELTKMMGTEKFNNLNLLTYVGKLNTSDLHFFMKEQQKPDESMVQPRALAEIALKGFSKFDPKGFMGSRASEGDLQLAADLRGKFFAQFDKRMRTIPAKERTTDKANEVIKDLLNLSEINSKWGDGISDKDVHEFEIPYLETSAEKKLAHHGRVPRKLQGIRGLEFNEKENFYTSKVGDITYLYEPIEGKLKYIIEPDPHGLQNIKNKKVEELSKLLETDGIGNDLDIDYSEVTTTSASDRRVASND